ncbi:MAG: HEAT repeat domain-containing protein [Verrucomicrobiales bacterium]|nr:HEAT repeat domain-containing protein [Verrucomicrobiales bacterium]
MTLGRLLPALMLALTAVPPSAATAPLELQPDDHVVLVGNTLADRMQHAGWLEALLYRRFPAENLVFRNLGFSGDELQTRLRSQDFGSPEEWLKHTGADVVLACFGFNESFQDEAGLEAFRTDLQRFIRETRGRDFGGRGPARLVLLSPIACERHPDPNYPDPEPLNRRLALYTRTMARVAAEEGVPFVDLFAISQRLYQGAGRPFTVNGIHLSEDGYQALAPFLYEALLGEKPAPMSGEGFARLRAAVLEKNALWFSRYRTVDGYNVYGGRSHLQFDGIKNRDSMQREMEMRDVMTANRDRRIWAVARGGDLEVRDDNLPPPVEVESNKPGPNPDGSHRFLGGEEAIAHMKLAAGCRANLFASEEEFPALANPVQMAFDTRGRLWVAAWPNYPERTPWSTTGDSLLVFEDTDGDGHADKCTPFVEDLNAPTGFQFHRDGVILVQAPDVWFLRDTDGDGRADWKQRILSGMDSADSHHTANALALDPAGAIYLSDGVFHRTQVETAWGVVRNNDAAIFRFEPRTGRFDTYIPYGFANPHGRVFDRWGNDLVTDATGNNTYFGPAISGRLPYPQKHRGVRQFWDRPSRPCPGTGLLSSRHFPEEFQGNFLNCNVIGFQGIFRVKVTEEGSGLTGETLEHLVQSDDPNFRPSAVDVGPDGAVYFLDWHNPLIGHMQHHLRDPSRDHQHGRIYRITYEGRPLLEPKRIAGAPITELLERLREPEDNVRTRAKIELGTRDTREVITAVRRWVGQFDPKAPGDQHALLEALWVCQWHNVVNRPLLQQLLRSPEPRARAAATRVLCDWRDRIPDVLTLLREQARDENPRVRLEAVRAASFFSSPEALAVAVQILDQPTDYYLDYVFNESLRVLPNTPKALLDLAVTDRARDYLVGRMNDAELLAAPDVEPVLTARTTRAGIDVNSRAAALQSLAALRHSTLVAETLNTLQRLDGQGSPAASAARDVGVMLAAAPAGQLAAEQARIASLARSLRHPALKQAAFAAWVAVDGEPRRAWEATARSTGERAALADSLILHADPARRAAFWPLLQQALADPATAPDVRQAGLRALPLTGPDHATAAFAMLARHLRDGAERPTAAYALRQLPRTAWSADPARPAADAILAWARTQPADKRTEQAYIETVQAGLDLATLLPLSEARRITQGLRELSVSVFVVKTVREQMRYDTTRLVVEAGKPFEVIFENNDMMAHNFVVVQPGAREEVGKQAEKMEPRPDRQGRLYIPDNSKILAASKMLEPGERTVLKLTAPATPGSYEYVCTYPEHWLIMYGQLLVVPDAEALLKASAEPPPAQPAAPTDHSHHDHAYE